MFTVPPCGCRCLPLPGNLAAGIDALVCVLGRQATPCLGRVLQEAQPRPLRIPNIVVAIDNWKTDERRIRTMRKYSDE